MLQSILWLLVCRICDSVLKLPLLCKVLHINHKFPVCRGSVYVYMFYLGPEQSWAGYQVSSVSRDQLLV